MRRRPFHALPWALLIAALSLVILLGGCACPVATPCPVVVDYSRDEDAAALAELSAHDLPALRRDMRDYAGLRAQARVCAAGRR